MAKSHAEDTAKIACSMQKRRGKAWEKESRGWCQVDVRVDVGGGAVPDKES